MEFFDAGSAEVREEHRVTKSYQLWVLCEKEDGTLSEPARTTLVFDIVCVFIMGRSFEIDRTVRTEWKNISIRLLSNDVQKALADLLGDIQTTVLYVESYVTQNYPHRARKEQTSSKALLHEIINESEWTISNLCESDFLELTKKTQTGASIQEIYEKICEGAITSVEEVAHQSVGVFLRHERSLTSLISSQQKERSHKTVVVYLYGATGVGKSQLSQSAATALDPKQPYYKSDGKWWDMYMNERVVVWDDFRGKSYMFSETLKLLDRYPYKVEKKGCMAKFNSEFIFITSNVSPTFCLFSYF